MKKKATKPNPLKVFNDNKAMAYKKAGGAMKDFKKSLKRAQEGTEMNDDLINKSGYGAKTTPSLSQSAAGIKGSGSSDNIKIINNPLKVGFGFPDAYEKALLKEKKLKEWEKNNPEMGHMNPYRGAKKGGAIKSKKK